MGQRHRQLSISAMAFVVLAFVILGCTGPNPSLPCVITVDAGTNQEAKVGEAITLSGSYSSANCTNINFLWEQIGGQGGVLSGEGTQSATFVAPNIPSEFEFRFTATSTEGTQSSATVRVIVVEDTSIPNPTSTPTPTPTPTPTNPMPVCVLAMVNAGPDQEVETGASVTLTGSYNATNCDDVSVTWTREQETTVSLNDTNMQSSVFIAPDVAGSLMFRFTVNAQGRTANDTVNVTVKAPPKPTLTIQPDPEAQVVLDQPDCPLGRACEYEAGTSINFKLRITDDKYIFADNPLQASRNNANIQGPSSSPDKRTATGVIVLNGDTEYNVNTRRVLLDFEATSTPEGVLRHDDACARPFIGHCNIPYYGNRDYSADYDDEEYSFNRCTVRAGNSNEFVAKGDSGEIDFKLANVTASLEVDCRFTRRYTFTVTTEPRRAGEEETSRVTEGRDVRISNSYNEGEWIYTGYEVVSGKSNKVTVDPRSSEIEVEVDNIDANYHVVLKFREPVVCYTSDVSSIVAKSGGNPDDPIVVTLRFRKKCSHFGEDISIEARESKRLRPDPIVLLTSISEQELHVDLQFDGVLTDNFYRGRCTNTRSADVYVQLEENHEIRSRTFRFAVCD